MIDDIHANPVRRVFVERPTDWEWSSARWYAGMTPVPRERNRTLHTAHSRPRRYPEWQALRLCEGRGRVSPLAKPTPFEDSGRATRIHGSHGSCRPAVPVDTNPKCERERRSTSPSFTLRVGVGQTSLAGRFLPVALRSRSLVQPGCWASNSILSPVSGLRRSISMIFHWSFSRWNVNTSRAG